MQHLEISRFPIFEPEEVSARVNQLLNEIQRETDSPEVPDWAKVVAVSPGSLETYLGMLQAFNHNFSLPQTIAPMILYSIGVAINCTYCTVSNELFCRAVGVNDETLALMANNIENVTPERLRAILKFAVKCATDPEGLAEVDYDQVRDEGITNDELMEIIFITGLAKFNHTVGESLKLVIDPTVLEELGYEDSSRQ